LYKKYPIKQFGDYMNNVKNLRLFCLLVLATSSTVVVAGTGIESVTQEERTAMREARRAELQSLSAEEKKAKKAERRTRFESMSSDERQAMRENRGRNNTGEPRAGQRNSGQRNGRRRRGGNPSQ
jgi:Flp pilus assembly protein TadB